MQYFKKGCTLRVKKETIEALSRDCNKEKDDSTRGDFSKQSAFKLRWMVRNRIYRLGCWVVRFYETHEAGGFTAERGVKAKENKVRATIEENKTSTWRLCENKSVFVASRLMMMKMYRIYSVIFYYFPKREICVLLLSLQCSVWIKMRVAQVKVCVYDQSQDTCGSLHILVNWILILETVICSIVQPSCCY